MSRASVEQRLWLATAIAVVAGACGAFWVPALARTHGHVPVPLDDVYIHFGFARSAALGHPFAWIPENGYSSGGTSLTYPLALAPGWLLGFRGESSPQTARGLTYSAADVAVPDYSKLNRLVLDEGFPHHLAVAMGDIAEDVRMLCKFLGVKFFSPHD